MNRRYPKKGASKATTLQYPLHLKIKVGGRWLPPIEVEDGQYLKAYIAGAKAMYENMTGFKTQKIVK
jgi:hypothetical protein